MLKRIHQNFAVAVIAILLVTIAPVHAAMKTVPIADGVYALVGELTQRSPANLGNNMTGGFVVTDEGVVLIDTGGSLLGAQDIHAAIREVTEKPIIYAINSGALDHRWFGNDYFKRQGAKLVAADAAVKAMHNQKSFLINMMSKNIKDKFDGTVPAFPEVTFKDRYTLPVNGQRIELVYTGGAHSPGDIVVWLPEHSVAFVGDIVFHQRLLGVPKNSVKAWIRSLEWLRDELQPKVVVPGHGDVTDVDGAMRDSYDYLVFLRDTISERIADGAFDPVEASQGIDQSRFSYLANYEQIQFRSRNALHVAQELFEETAEISTPPVSDPRELLPLPYETRNKLLHKMNEENLGALGQMLEALSRDDFGEVARVANSLSYSTKTEQGAPRRGSTTFAVMATDFHGQKMPAVREAAEKGDRREVLRRMSEAVNSCMACHAAVRLVEWPDNRSYETPGPVKLPEGLPKPKWKISNYKYQMKK